MTGASRGIGRAIAERLARDGRTVVGVGVRVGGLVIIHRRGKRNEDGGAAAGGEFREGARAGAGDDEIGGRIDGVHLVAKT